MAGMWTGRDDSVGADRLDRSRRGRWRRGELQLHGKGNGAITGAVIAQDRVDSVSSTIDDVDIGNGDLAYSCPAVRNGGGTVSNNWLISSYKEVQGI